MQATVNRFDKFFCRLELFDLEGAECKIQDNTTCGISKAHRIPQIESEAVHNNG